MINMNKYKCLSVVLLHLLLSAAVATAFDWGGSITNASEFRSVAEDSEEDAFFQSNSISLYLRTPLGARTDFIAEGAYTFTTERAVLLNLRSMHMTRTVEPESGPRQFGTRLGRFNIADPTGEVLNHPVDGIRLRFVYPILELDLTTGYTGFLFAPAANVSMSKLDQTDDEDDELLAPGRLLGKLSANLNEIVLGQSVALAILFQEDLRDPNDPELIEPGVDTADPTRGGLLDTQYAVLSIDGPLAGSFFYTVYGVANTGRTLSFVEDEDTETGQVYEYQPFLAGLFGLSLDYFLPQFLSSRVSLFGRLGTGDSDYSSYTEGNTAGEATMFTPITAAPAGAVLAVEPGNSAHIGVSYSARPFADSNNGWLERLQGELAGYSFFRTAGEGATSVSAVDSDSSESYLGSEIDFSLRARPYSDFGIGLTTGLFVANGDALVEGANETDFIVRIDASLSF